jgi:hypothetical protein
MFGWLIFIMKGNYHWRWFGLVVGLWYGYSHWAVVHTEHFYLPWGCVPFNWLWEMTRASIARISNNKIPTKEPGGNQAGAPTD